jgi:hypothetical protein
MEGLTCCAGGAALWFSMAVVFANMVGCALMKERVVFFPNN